jgi:hypothetical protein
MANRILPEKLSDLQREIHNRLAADKAGREYRIADIIPMETHDGWTLAVIYVPRYKCDIGSFCMIWMRFFDLFKIDGDSEKLLQGKLQSMIVECLQPVPVVGRKYRIAPGSRIGQDRSFFTCEYESHVAKAEFELVSTTETGMSTLRAHGYGVLGEGAGAYGNGALYVSDRFLIEV